MTLLRRIDRALAVAEYTLLGALVLTVGVAAYGCGQQWPDPMAAESGDPNCGTDALAKIIAARAIELRHACGSAPVDKCENREAEEVRAKFDAKLDAWEKCGE